MRVNWRVVVCVGYLAPSMAPYTMMRPAKASCTAVHDLLICELTMAPKKNLTKKNTAVKSTRDQIDGPVATNWRSLGRGSCRPSSVATCATMNASAKRTTPWLGVGGMEQMGQ